MTMPSPGRCKVGQFFRSRSGFPAPKQPRRIRTGPGRRLGQLLQASRDLLGLLRFEKAKHALQSMDCNSQPCRIFFRAAERISSRSFSASAWNVTRKLFRSVRLPQRDQNCARVKEARSESLESARFRRAHLGVCGRFSCPYVRGHDSVISLQSCSSRSAGHIAVHTLSRQPVRTSSKAWRSSR